jgi:hypothetical protein
MENKCLMVSWSCLQLKSDITIVDNIAVVNSQQEKIKEEIRERNEQPTSDTRSREASEDAINQGRQETEDYDFFIRGPSHDAKPLTGHRYLSFPDIHLNSTSSVSSVLGDRNALDSSHHVTNTNSGNTTTSVTTNSNNDSSVRVRRRAYLLTPLRFFPC